jgi:FtsH-binding integral membrane protein
MQDHTLRREAVLASEAPVEARRAFIKRTYAHLAAAIFVFMGVEYLLINSSLSYKIMQTLGSWGRGGWLAVLLLFIGVGWIARRWASADSSPGLQYLGLGVYVVAEAFIFVPILWICTYVSRYDGLIATAGLITGIVFAGLTAIVFLTKADFSWMRTMLGAAALVVLGILVASLIFGFQLGIIYCAAVVLLAAGYILYDTSNILHKYSVSSHVAASLALFADVALMFWYVLRILMSRR